MIHPFEFCVVFIPVLFIVFGRCVVSWIFNPGFKFSLKSLSLLISERLNLQYYEIINILLENDLKTTMLLFISGTI